MKLRQQYVLILGSVSVLIILTISAAMALRHKHMESLLLQSSFNAMSESLYIENENAARALTMTLTDSLVEPIAVDDFEGIANVAKSARKLPRVSKLIVFDAQGLLVHDGTDQVSEFGTLIPSEILDVVTSNFHTVSERKNDFLKVCAPVHIDNRVLGGIYLEFKLDYVDSHIQDLKSELEYIIKSNDLRDFLLTTLLAIMVCILAVLGGFFISRHLSQPILTLAELTRRIGQGEYGIKTKVTSRQDELGELAQSIHWMSNELSNHTYTKAQLENLIKVRTAELEDANQKLLQIDETRREFLTDLGHELRTPLTAIRGISEVRLRSSEYLNNNDSSALKRIVELCGQLGSLVDDLLFIARSETGKPVLDTTTLSLCALLSNVKEQMAEIAKQNQIKLIFTCDHDSLIEGDPRRLKQLFSILIDNAIKYSKPSGIVKIEITTRTGIPQNFADVRISDTGIGMTKDEKDQSTIRFFRGKRAQEKHDKGMGLGLSIARAIMSAHGINFNLSSEINKGTTALVTFNLDVDSFEENQDTSQIAGM